MLCCGFWWSGLTAFFFNMSFLLRKIEDVTTISKSRSLTSVSIKDCTLSVPNKTTTYFFTSNNKSNLHCTAVAVMRTEACVSTASLYTHTRASAHTHACMHTVVRTHVHTHMYTRTHAHTHTCTETYTHNGTHVRTRTQINNTYMHTSSRLSNIFHSCMCTIDMYT